MRFALIGAAGYIAPRHLQAIKDVNGELVAAMDPHYGVGILDRYYPDAMFYTDFERFQKHIEYLRYSGKGVDYVAIASPNHLHASHIIFALKHGANAICEKPLVVDVDDINNIRRVEEETGKKAYTILQLRLHPKLLELKKRLSSNKSSVSIEYITPRGQWYFESWKGDHNKSGGVAMNIGVHLFDMMIWLFGKYDNVIINERTPKRVSGTISLERAQAKFFLSIDMEDSKRFTDKSGPYRSISIDGEQIEFSDGFTDLHTLSYEKILGGEGFGIDDALPSIELVSKINNAMIVDR